MSLSPEPTTDPRADLAGMPYERAREELVAVVQRLESGQAPLEEAMHLWERGEALAQHCQSWLDEARARLNAASQSEQATQAPSAFSGNSSL